MPDKSDALTGSTSARLDAFCTSNGRTKSQTLRSLSAPVSWAYPLCSFRDAFAGSDMSTAWRHSAYHERFSTENCATALVVSVDLCCASKTPSSATLKQPSLMLPAGRTLLLIESPGGTVSKQEPWELRKTEEFRQHWRERRESSVRPPRAPHQPTSAPTAWGTATPGLGFTAMRDPALPILCANHRLFETWMPTIWIGCYKKEIF